MEDIQEQLDESGVMEGEIDRLREENSILTQQVVERDERITRLEETMAGRETELSHLRENGESSRKEIAGLNDSLSGAIGAYRELIVQSSPGLPEDMITGDTIAEIVASAENARALVEQVRQELEAETNRQRVPAGAPPRSAPDTSGLSAREKIHFALGVHRE